jgi:parallel beta-helix repeat protein
MRFNQIEVKAPNGYPVHNLNTGLNYTTIQEAIDANETLDGHTIFVEKGTYSEHVVFSKGLALIGEDRDATMIDGSGTGVVVQLGTNVNVTSLTIRNGEYGVRIWGYGFEPVYTGNTIIDSKIMDNLYGAILIRAGANNTIINNIITNNTLFGIHLWNAGNNTIISNTVSKNGQGIDFYGNSNDNILRNNNMTDNTYNFGLILRGETRNFLIGAPSKPRMANDVDPSNTINGKPIYFLVNRSNEYVPSDAGYVWLDNCTNITINGCNLSKNLQGVLLLSTNNASIINSDIANNVYGIYVGIYSTDNTLVGNTLKDNVNGVYLEERTKFTTMRDNNITGGQMNFGISPDVPQYIEDIDFSNTVDGKPIVYWINQHDRQVPTNAGYVVLINSSQILIKDLNLSNNVQNIFLLSTNDTVILNNSITNSIYGIDVMDIAYLLDSSTYTYYTSYNTTVKGNVLVDNCVGLRVKSNNSTILNNTLIRNPLGIYLKETSNSMVSKNVVVASDLNMTYPGPDLCIFYYPEWSWERSTELSRLIIGGIIVGGDYNMVYGNTVTNSWLGISIDVHGGYLGSGNIIFNNNIINSTNYQAVGWRGNSWDNGYPSGGNYWSNYNGTDFYSGQYKDEAGSDGIGDKGFIVFPISDYGVVDDYPLMAPISIFDVGPWNGVNCDVSIISNSTISNFQLNKTQKTMSFNVTGETSLRFCRVTIPNVIVQEFWEGIYTVLINGQPIESRDWTDQSNTYIYFNYTHSTQEVIIMPEFPSFLVLPPFMTATSLLITVYKRKHDRQQSQAY